MRRTEFEFPCLTLANSSQTQLFITLNINFLIIREKKMDEKFKIISTSKKSVTLEIQAHIKLTLLLLFR